jgi:hypothetical protein
MELRGLLGDRGRDGDDPVVSARARNMPLGAIQAGSSPTRPDGCGDRAAPGGQGATLLIGQTFVVLGI